MGGYKKSILFRAKAVLCALLVLNPIWITGCTRDYGLPGAGGKNIHIDLVPDHPLSIALKDTAFAGAKALDIDTHSMRFHLSYDDGDREITGAYALGGSDWTVTEFTFYRPDTEVRLAFDEARRLMSLDTSDGISWKRAMDQASEISLSPSTSNENPYLVANADILQTARELDEAQMTVGFVPSTGEALTASDPTSSDLSNAAEKNNTAQGVALGLALGTAAILFAPLLGVLTPMVAIFGVTMVFEDLFGNRFDGTWLASNSGSSLVVVIQGARITSISDQKNQQGYEIVDSQRGTTSGDRIEWEVLVNVLGQQAQVEFQFDMQEQANGSLVGTLTALGSTFSRVPITMERI